MINQKITRNIKFLNELYKHSSPFPHIIIDDFMEGLILNQSLQEIQNFGDWSFDDGLPSYQVNKFYTPATDNVENTKNSLQILSEKAPTTHKILNYLYSDEILKVLSDLTGIQNLIPDSSWFGAGVHKVVKDGRLAIHADFNLNWRINKYRRINLLLYLNKDWKEEYNGYLELWKRDMSACELKIAPLYNRVVIFNTDRTSYHGHTLPLNIPENIARYSLALYYYTNDPPPDDEEQRFVTWKNEV